MRLRAIGEYLRSWRVEGQQFAIAQAFRPAANIEYSIGKNWAVEASVAYSRNMGFHAYDAVESGFNVSYAMPFGRTFEEQNLGIPLEDALRSLCRRVPNLDLKFFATAIILQRSTGGDLAEILDKIGHLIRERFRIWRQVQALN